MFTTENAEISDDFWKRRTRLYFSYYKRAFFIKALKSRRFGNDIVQSVSVVFHGAFRWLFFYNQKSFVRRRLRRCRLRHEIHTIKTRPNNPLRFLQCKNSIRRYLANDLTCAARKTTFKTRKRFHNKQYTHKSKDQPHGSDRTHFDIGFNNGSIAIHRPTIFSSFSQNHNRSIKNQNKITSNNHNKQSTQPLNQKHSQNKHNKQLRKNEIFFEY